MRVWVALSIVQTEWRLLLRSMSFRLYPVLLCLLVVGVIWSAFGFNHWLDILVQIVNNIIFFQFPLMALIVSPSVVRNRDHSGDWLWTTPLEVPLLVLSQTLALTLAIIGALIPPIVVGALVLVLRGVMPLNGLPTYGGYALALLLPSTLLELGIVFSLSLLLRRSVAVILLVTALDALLWLGLLVPTATLLAAVNHTLLTLHLDPVVGLGAERALLLPLFLLYTSLPVALLALAMWGFSRTDRRSGWRPGRGWMVGGGVIVGAVAVLLSLVQHQASARARTIPMPVTDQVDMWVVEAASHRGYINSADMTIDATLMLHHLRDEAVADVIVALNPGLQVTEASINAHPVNVQREGEVIRLTELATDVGAGDTILIKLAYRGAPQLMREDYSVVMATVGNDPATFQHPVHTYFDRSALLLQRDGNWRVWPVQANRHAALEEDTLELRVERQQPIISSGEIITQATSMTYSWVGPLPQFLIASAPYREHDQPDLGTVWLAPLSLPQDERQAHLTLRLRKALDEWLNNTPTARRYEAVILPYVNTISIGDTTLGLPATGRDWHPGYGSEVQTISYAQELALGAALSQSWLGDQMMWPQAPLTTTGQLRNFRITCQPPDATGQQECVTTSLGGINPQAPHGRIVNQEQYEGERLLYALSAVMGRHLAEQIAEPTDAATEASQLWLALAQPSTASGYNRTRAEARDLLRALHLLPVTNATTPVADQDQEIAQLVLSIEELHDQVGSRTFARLLQDLAVHYPPHGPPLTEEAFWQLANQQAVWPHNGQTAEAQFNHSE